MHLMSESQQSCETVAVIAMTGTVKPNVQTVMQNVLHVLNMHVLHVLNRLRNMFLRGLRNFYGPYFNLNAMIYA